MPRMLSAKCKYYRRGFATRQSGTAITDTALSNWLLAVACCGEAERRERSLGILELARGIREGYLARPADNTHAS